MTGDIGHGLALDSGTVRLAGGPPRLAGDIVGVGTELGNLQRVTVIALPAPPILLTPKGIEHVGPRAFGYDLDFRSVFA